jgi:hypothetical protein
LFLFFYFIYLFIIIFFFVTAEPLAAFGRLAWQLLQDVQERLVFRAHLYLKSDIEEYKPASGDLAYPEKLEMMEVS